LLLAALLSAGGLGLGFFMVHEGYDSVAAWIAVIAAVLSAAIVAGRASRTR
jgi:acyl CoA:acetate/3-ketoacid CoA transferase alpha subunit